MNAHRRAGPGRSARGAWKRRGTTAVQFAFVAPIFMFFVLGSIEVGRGLMATTELTSAARDACRACIVQQGQSTDTIKANVTNILKPQGITTQTTTVKVNGDATKNASSAVTGDEVQVLVTVPVGDVTWLPVGYFLQGNLSGKWALIKE